MKVNRKFTVIGNILMILSVGFIVYRLKSAPIDFYLLTKPEILRPILVCAGLYALMVLFTAWIYNYLIRGVLKENLPYPETMQYYLEANLYKYLPGNIFHLVGRNKIALNSNISVAQLTIITTLEILLVVLSGLLLSVGLSGRYFIQILQTMVFENPVVKRIGLTILFVFIAVGITLAVYFKSRMVSFIRQLRLSLIDKSIIFSFILYLLVFIIQGSIFYLALTAISQQQLTAEFGLIIGVYAVGWTLGFLIPGAPGGIGIREAAMSVLLSQLVSEKNILTTAVIHRVITIIGDVISYLVIKIYVIIDSKKTSEDNKP